MKVSNIYNPISEEERFQVYRRILKIFISSGGSTKDGEKDGKTGQSERCSICETEP